MALFKRRGSLQLYVQLIDASICVKYLKIEKSKRAAREVIIA